jgi:hypothetical protein
MSRPRGLKTSALRKSGSDAPDLRQSLQGVGVGRAIAVLIPRVVEQTDVIRDTAGLVYQFARPNP